MAVEPTFQIIDDVRYLFPDGSNIEIRDKILFVAGEEVPVRGLDFQWPKYFIDVFVEGTTPESVDKIIQLIDKYKDLA